MTEQSASASADATQPRTWRFGDENERVLAVNDKEKWVRVDNVRVGLTGKEFELFQFFTLREGKLCSRLQCMEHLYGVESLKKPKIIEVFLSHLRKKLGAAMGEYECIETIWGSGWRFVGPRKK